MKTQNDVSKLLYEIKQEFQSFRVVEKSGWFWTFVGWLVFMFTFGGNRVFKSAYVTTIGPMLCTPSNWMNTVSSATVYATLIHERVHLRQMRRCGLGSFWLGIVPFTIAYLFLPIPIGFAYCRYLFEREAYTESIKFDYLEYGDIAAKKRIDRSVEQLTRGYYAWTYPFPKIVKNYFAIQLTRIKREQAQALEKRKANRTR